MHTTTKLMMLILQCVIKIFFSFMEPVDLFKILLLLFISADSNDLMAELSFHQKMAKPQ
jgi:hypothetical protein